MRATNARTVQWFEARGYIAQTVETWIPYASRRRDLFGFGDVLAVGDEIVIGQSTSRSNVSSRVNKILAEPRAVVCLRAGIRILVMGWAKGKVRIVEIVLNEDGSLETHEMEEAE